MSEKKIRLGFVSDYLTSEYADDLVHGITSYCIENDLELLLFPIGDMRHLPNNYNFHFSVITNLITKENLDGIIVTSGTLMHGVSKEDFTAFLKNFDPLKIVNIAAKIPGIPSIEVDCNQAFDAMIQYLIDEQDCRKFAFMGVKSLSEEVALRTRIFKNVLKRNNITDDNVIYWEAGFDYQSAYNILNAYSRDGGKFDFDAIISLNDDMAFACVDYCMKRMNLNVPKDIIVTGFDNIQRTSFSNPTLTSVNQQIEFLGYSAARTLHQTIRGKKVPDYQTIRAKTILRKSTDKKRGVQESFSGNSYIAVDLRTSKDFTNTFSVSEWYNRRSQILQAASFYTSVAPNTTFDYVGQVLTNNLRSFGFQAAAVVTYEHPIETGQFFENFVLPRKACLLAGFHYKKVFNTTNFSEPYYFNPNECLIPPEFFDFPSVGTIVTALFANNVHYGYLLLQLHDYDAVVYDLIQRAISSQLQASYDYTKVVEEQSEMKNQNQQLDLIAHTDELTGLRNRRGFLDLGQAALNISKEMHQEGLVVYCDMDGLKKINDTYGHESGDVAIKAQASILNKAFRTNDILGRLGGDEFAVVCPGLTEVKLEKIKEKVNKACKEWKRQTKSVFDLSISMGCIKYPAQKEGYNMSSLLSLADSCLYLEKRAKKMKKTR